MSVLAFEINTLPDLTLNRYESLAETGVKGVLKRHESFLRQWHGICSASETSFHLLYLFLPELPVGQRMKLFFLLQGSPKRLEMVEPLLYNSPLSEFFQFRRETLPEVEFQSGATLLKAERAAPIRNRMTGQKEQLYYVPKWEINEDARLYDLMKIMETIGKAYTPARPCGFRLDLYPVSMAQSARTALQTDLKKLRGEMEIRLIDPSGSQSADNDARDLENELDDWLKTLETSPHFRAYLYGFAGSLFQAKTILNAAGAEAVSEGDYSIVPIRPDGNGAYTPLSRMGAVPEDHCAYPQSLPGWPTTFSLKDATPFFRLPALFDGEAVEIPKETAPKAEANGIFLGWDNHGYPVQFPVEYLPRHAFFTGMPGAGKTNTMLHLITELRKKGIPFLVMEPAKKEYRALLGDPEMDDVFLFSPHLQSHFPLHVNPFEFPRGVRLSDHISALLEVFRGSFVLEGPTYKYLSGSIQSSYEALGWDVEDTYDEMCRLEFPTLQDVYDRLEKEIESSGYDAEFKGNLRSFLQVRLGSLMERDAGELFHVSFSTLAPEDWLHCSAIVELESLPEQVKNFFVLLICHYIKETLSASPKEGTDEKGNLRPVRHALFIEEAHNIIAPDTEQQSQESVDPKISATAYLVAMLAEVRALREAIIIADQLPTALASQVTKNTGLKLVHRLTAQDDREQIGSAISASPLQLEQMTTFTKGRALIHHERVQKPFEVQIAEWKQPECSYDVAFDEELYLALCGKRALQQTLEAAVDIWLCKYVRSRREEAQKLNEKRKKLPENDTGGELRIKGRLTELLLENQNIRKKWERKERLWFSARALNDPFRDRSQRVRREIDDVDALISSFLI